jgi:alcohol dehydrogenase class IV
MGYSLTYFKDIDHGRANGLTMAAYLDFLKRERGDKIETMLKALGLKDIERLKGLLDFLLGERESVTSVEIERFAAVSIQAKNIGNTPGKPTKANLVAIYEASLRHFEAS